MYQFKYIKKERPVVCTSCGQEKKIFYKSGKLLERVMLCYECNRKRKNKRATGEKKIFDEIWEEREHVSFLSDRPLVDPFGNVIHKSSSFYPNCFAHVLNKGKYPHFRLKKENIVLLTPAEHFMLDQGTIQHRDNYAEATGCDWGKIFELKERLIQQYEEEKKGF
jgi:hypothetical protein